MGRKPMEAVIGAVVLLVAFSFLYLLITTAEVGNVQGYEVTAKFSKVSGLQAGTSVRISGIHVGTVSQLTLDPESYEAVVTLTIKSGVEVPEDTVAIIGSEGQFGGKFVRLMPGKSSNSLAAGAAIDRTEHYRSLEDQVGEIIFLSTGRDRDGGGTK